ncbi:AGE family epimerase/isomerase [Tessaracoccus lubricantis]|uniref:AGE family epimerase/isomerase n=1 Tax=Tessaracoccus lubricantis TaxID=545543 RepID=A0ABP9FC59_9ACTN
MPDLTRDSQQADVLRMSSQARSHLLDEILPFWIPNSIDRTFGGYFTCYDNRGQFVSDAKYTWSQGRFIAVCSMLAQAARDGSLPLDADELISDAIRGAEFLYKYAIRPDFTTHYVLERSGEPAGQQTPSVYADCFAAMGFARVAQVSEDPRWYKLAEKILHAATETSRLPEIPTAPYQLPRNVRPYGVSMILLNVELDMAAARAALGMERQDDALKRAVEDVWSFARSDGLYNEVLSEELDPASLLKRHRTPGHSLEGLWMMALALEEGATIEAQIVEQAVALCELGWDDQFGGILRYTDAEGGPPHGSLLGIPYEDLVRRTWATKLWWVHSEATWTTALLAHRSGDQRLIQWRNRIWDYTRATFPARGEGKEWIQIRDRRGHPLDEVVALPLKDPYHLIRNLLQVIELSKPQLQSDPPPSTG